MTVIQYCREKTNVRELVIIREGRVGDVRGLYRP